MNIDVTISIPDTRIMDLLTKAFEGGVNYWAKVSGYKHAPKPNLDGEYYNPYAWLPLTSGGVLYIEDITDNITHSLYDSVVRRGLQLMAEEYTEHFQNFINGNADAVTADVFLQCCIFGEVPYG